MDKSATQWMVEPLKKYAIFSGRARRAEFWWFQLLCFLVGGALLFGEIAIVGFDQAMNSVLAPVDIFSLAILVPTLTVSFRRLHDIDRSAWWLLIAVVPLVGIFVLLYWHCQPGTVGENRFGMDPIGS